MGLVLTRRLGESLELKKGDRVVLLTYHAKTTNSEIIRVTSPKLDGHYDMEFKDFSGSFTELPDLVMKDVFIRMPKKSVGDQVKLDIVAPKAVNIKRSELP